MVNTRADSKRKIFEEFKEDPRHNNQAQTSDLSE